MKKLEVIHTLRLYDANFIGKLSALMEREKENYRSTNEFLTELLKRGCDSYIAADKSGKTTNSAAADNSNVGSSGAINTAVVDGVREMIKQLISLTDYIMVNSRITELYNEVFTKRLGANYNMLLALTEGRKLMPSLVENGFYDDLPPRFEKIIRNHEKRADLN